jgi:hypothetical protein
MHDTATDLTILLGPQEQYAVILSAASCLTDYMYVCVHICMSVCVKILQTNKNIGIIRNTFIHIYVIVIITLSGDIYYFAVVEHNLNIRVGYKVVATLL